MTYWSEFRPGWRPLVAAALGMGTGLSATGVVTSIMAPHFMKDLHWTPSAFAQVGVVSALMAICIPIAGRLADVWGVRHTAAIGVIALPLCMVGFSRMTSDISQYYVLFIIQGALCVTTTATVPPASSSPISPAPEGWPWPSPPPRRRSQASSPACT